MSNRRTITDFPRNEAGLVDEFIGTAYDTVKAVYDALPEIRELYEIADEIPELGEQAVEAAMVPARAEIASLIGDLDSKVGEAEEWANQAEQSAIAANKINLSFPFLFNELQSVYDVSVISGRNDITTAGMSLWIEGAIDYNYVINSSKLFTLLDTDDLQHGASMRLMINARFDDLITNLDQFQDAMQDEFDESQASREAEFLEFLENSDYEVPVLYEPGIVLSRPSQTVLFEGYAYRVDPLYLPLTTTNWTADSPKMKLVGDNKLREDMAGPNGTDLSAFTRKPYLLNRGIESAGDFLNVNDVFLQEFAEFVVDGDWSYAFDQAFAFGAAFPGPGAGGRLRLGGGRFNLKREVVIPFGWTLIGNSADQFGTKCCPIEDFVGECMFRFTTGVSYMNGTWDSICIDMLNMPGIHCMIFEGAYRNSAVKNCVFNNVAYNAAGLIVRPLTGVGKQAVCESFLLSDFYVIKDQTNQAQEQTVNGIQLYKVQETILSNVKSFHASNPAPTRGGAAIYMEDCLGITILSGGVVGANQGIHIHAKTKNVSGINIVGMTWENNAVNDIKVTGEGGFVCSTIMVPSMRREFPFSSSTLDLSSTIMSEFHIGTGSITAASNCNNTIIYSNGAGARNIATGAQITLFDTGNAVTPTPRLSPGLDLYSNNTPKLAFSVNGRSGKWDFRWNASDVADNGFQLYSALGARILEITDTGTPLFRVTKRVNIKADNTAQLNFEITGRTGSWRWEWSADATTDNGFRATSPEGVTVLSAKTVAGAANLGFFGGVMSPQRTVTGSRTSSDPILVSILNALAAHGLLINNTTA